MTANRISHSANFSHVIISLVLGLSSLLGGCFTPTPLPPPPTPSPPGCCPPTSVPPTPTPLPPTPTLDQTIINLALNAQVTASRYIQGHEPEKAVDGIDDLDIANWWGSGGHPPQWIEIDLGLPAQINLIRLVISQTPTGSTFHLVMGRLDGEDGYINLARLVGVTADREEIILPGNTDWTGIRYVRIYTSESPSWVSWREIEVFGYPVGH